jgi:hypothetical protein
MTTAARDIWTLDQVTEVCGYFTSRTTVNNGYGCRHPKQQDIEDEYQEPGKPPPVPPKCGRCFSFTCPLGLELHPSEEPEDAEEFRARGMDPTSMSDGEWMLVAVTEDGALVGANEEHVDAVTVSRAGE